MGTTKAPFGCPARVLHNACMSHFGEKICHLLFPEKFRKYLTFRLMTVFVAALAASNLVFSVIYKTPLRPQAANWSRSHLVLHNAILAVGSWLIYATRRKEEYYWLRVVFYGMLLGGLVGEILVLVPRFMA